MVSLQFIKFYEDPTIQTDISNNILQDEMKNFGGAKK